MPGSDGASGVERVGERGAAVGRQVGPASGLSPQEALGSGSAARMKVHLGKGINHGHGKP